TTSCRLPGRRCRRRTRCSADSNDGRIEPNPSSLEQEPTSVHAAGICEVGREQGAPVNLALAIPSIYTFHSMAGTDTPTAPSNTPRLLIVDGHAYAYRAFFAIRRLTSPTGAPTNAIYGFVKMLAKMREHLRPTHLAVVWDGGLAAERVAALPGYKAQRPE